MSESEPSARPRQLTMAGGFVIGGSLILLFTVFDTITNLHSVDTRDQVTKMLTSQTGEGLGLSISEALSGMRFGLMVAAVCAAASAILGVFVLQRHRGARVALSVLAVPILVTSPLTGVLLGVLVAASTLALWSGPARDWFDGRPVRQPPEPLRRGQDGPTPPRPDFPPPAAGQPGAAGSGAGQSGAAGSGAGQPGAGQPGPPRPKEGPSASEVSTEQPSTTPAATPGFGQQRPATAQISLPVQQWAPPAGGPVAWQQPTVAVPLPVKVACLLTWAFAGVVALMYAVMVVALVVAKDTLVDYVASSPEWDRANLQTDLILPVLWLGCLMFLGWSVGAMVLAWFTWRRHNWARYLLAGSAGVALVASLFAFPVGLVHQVAAAITIAALFSARSREWFARPTGRPGPPYGPPPGQYAPPSDQYGPPPGQFGPPPGQYGPPPPAAPPPDQSGKPPVW